MFSLHFSRFSRSKRETITRRNNTAQKQKSNEAFGRGSALPPEPGPRSLDEASASNEGPQKNDGDVQRRGRGGAAHAQRCPCAAQPEVHQRREDHRERRDDERAFEQEHDLEAFNEEAKKFGMNVVMLGVIHYQWEALLPIMLHCVTGPLAFICSPLCQCFILGGFNGFYPGALLSKDEEKALRMGTPITLPTVEELVNRRPFPAAKSMGRGRH